MADFIVKFSNFSSNSAQKSGGIIKIKKKLAIFENNHYFDNWAIYGNEFAAYPIRLDISAYWQFLLQNYTDYQSFCDMSANSTYFSENNMNYSLFYNSSICSEKFALRNETPGIQITTYMKFRLIDYFNQTVNTQNGGLCFIEAKSTENYENQAGIISPNLIGFTTTTLIDGSFFILSSFIQRLL